MPILPKIYTATADENGNAVLHIDDPGLYQVNASIDDGINTAISDTVFVYVSENRTTQAISLPFATISIRTDQGNVVTATDGTDSFTFTAASDDPTVVHVNLGDWTVSTTIEGETKSKTISVQAYQAYSVSLLPVQFVTRTMDFQTNTSTLDTSEGTIEDMLPFVGRRRCNVADDGTINAWYGDANYTEDGSNGQVMVYQPKFYYKTTPITLDGVKIRKASWSIADNEADGYKLHPAFYDEDGNEVDYILIGAFKACLYDTSASVYDKTDSITHSYTVGTGDKLSSIADAKPVSGYKRTFTRVNCEITAENRGAGWHQNNIRVASLNQMMMIVEYGGNMQTLVGRGVVDLSSGSYNGSSITGSTYDIGNGTGRATLTYNSTSGTGSRTSYTVDGKTSVCYRGMEDPWGNIYEFIDGINMYGAQPYIATDYNWSESKNTGNYVSCGFTAATSNYISAFGYNETFDWLFIGAETSGSDSTMIGDYQYASTSSSYYIASLGGVWSGASGASAFCWALDGSVSGSSRLLGARTTYVPQTNRS